MCPEAPLKSMFEVAFGDLSEAVYSAWFSTSAYQRVTVNVDGVEVTGILATSGMTGVYNACLLLGGCVNADPCDCVEFWWSNKPSNPCE